MSKGKKKEDKLKILTEIKFQKWKIAVLEAPR